MYIGWKQLESNGECFTGFLDDIMNKIGGERGGIRRKVEDEYVNIGVPLSRYQVYGLYGVMNLFPEV